MLSICEEYATAYCVQFNASKSKCIICASHYMNKSCMSDKKVLFTVNGSPIEIVDSWTHLGHVICQDCDDSLDINKCCDKLIRQINSVLCTFAQLDATVKTDLLKSYCLSLYGCELSDLNNRAIEKVCK